MNSEMNKLTVLSNLFWKLMERSGTQGIQLLVQVILARLLLPADYGVIAIMAIFLSIAGVFVQSGLNTALIQKKDADDIDFSSVFFLSLLIAGLCYIALFVSAPAISHFYQEPRLILVMRVLGLTLFMGAFNSIQNAVIAKGMKFKKLFFSSIGAIVISGIVGIVMAYAGLGVWALVGQQLTNQLMITSILWFTVNWRPRFILSFSRLRLLFSFGWKLLASSLLNMLSGSLRSLIIGKVYTPTMLGYYDMGSKLPGLIIENINGSILAVMLPTLSFHQDDKLKVKSLLRRAIVTSSFIVFPMMAGFAIIAQPLVIIMLTEKWLPTVPFIQLTCIAYAFWPFHSANLQAINAMGRSDIFLKLEIIKVALALVMIAVTLPFGIYALVIGGTAVGVVSTYINAYPNKQLLNYAYLEQIKDILPSFLLTFAMSGIIISLQLLNLSPLLTLIIQVIVGACSYTLMAKIFKLECFNYLIETLKQIKEKKQNSNAI
jgi:teichuronic acid exporter